MSEEIIESVPETASIPEPVKAFDKDAFAKELLTNMRINE